MRTSSRLKLTTIFSLLLLIVVGLTLRNFGSITTHAASVGHLLPITSSAPITIPELAPPGNPLMHAKVKSNGRTAQGLQYFYADTYQYANATGVVARLSQHRPQLATSDYHSLAEIAAESFDGQQIVEIGWTVDRSVNGDTNPHLFIFHWVNGSPTCYNACGFVQVSTKHYPGMRVTVTQKAQMYGIKFFNNAWWVGYQNDWFGYFPSILWNVTFSSLGLAQWFGEVAALEPNPCTDMGDALYGSKTNSAIVNGISFINGPKVSITSGTVSNSAYYNLGHVTATSFSYGGPGAC